MDIEFLIKEYESGKSFAQISKNLEISTMTLYRKIKPYISSRKRRHILRDENFLKSIDCEWKAYFLGLLWADGNMRTLNQKRKDSCSINISLIASDSEILEKLWFEIFSSPISLATRKARQYFDKINKKTFNSQESKKLIINSKIIYNDLIKLGCSPAKSTSIDLPYISANLFHHFVRGYFDGDGWIDRNRYVFGCIGSHEFCSSLKEDLENLLSINLKIIKCGKVSRLIGQRKKDAENFAKWLYKDSTFFISRKKIKFDRLQK